MIRKPLSAPRELAQLLKPFWPIVLVSILLGILGGFSVTTLLATINRALNSVLADATIREKLLAQGADPAQQDARGATALMAAQTMGAADAVARLQAEREGAVVIRFPKELEQDRSVEVQAALKSQRDVFAARRRALGGRALHGVGARRCALPDHAAPRRASR